MRIGNSGFQSPPKPPYTLRRNSHDISRRWRQARDPLIFIWHGRTKCHPALCQSTHGRYVCSIAVAKEHRRSMLFVSFRFVYVRFNEFLSVSVVAFRLISVHFTSILFVPVRLGSSRVGSFRFFYVRFGPIRFGSFQCVWHRFGSVRFVSGRVGSFRCVLCRLRLWRFVLVRFGSGPGMSRNSPTPRLVQKR